MNLVCYRLISRLYNLTIYQKIAQRSKCNKVISRHLWFWPILCYLRRILWKKPSLCLCLCLSSSEPLDPSIYFSDTFRTSVRSRQMWVRPEPGSASPWRRSCFPDTWSSCFQTTSWQSEQDDTKAKLSTFTTVKTTSEFLFQPLVFCYPDLLSVFLEECLSHMKLRWRVIYPFIKH